MLIIILLCDCSLCLQSLAQAKGWGAVSVKMQSIISTASSHRTSQSQHTHPSLGQGRVRN